MPRQPKFQVIYPDPPWMYRDKQSNRGKTYRRMSFKELAAMGVGSLAAPDALLFLWSTMPMLPQAIALMPHWGFRYRTTAFVWIKTRRKDHVPAMGMGQWTRSNAEACLLGVRGRPKRVGKSVHSVIVEPRRDHSRKPDCVRDRIVELAGNVPRLEMFCRGQVPRGWWGHGDQATGARMVSL